MEFKSKFFNELTVCEVYEILKSRAEVFMLEQGIICQDMDNVDYDSLHCFMTNDDRIVAYLRAFKDVKNEGNVVVGRVLTLEHKKGIGTELMNKSIKAIKNAFCAKKISVHAQKQAFGFYDKMGFSVVSDEFLEEGVVHLTMELSLE